MNSSSKINAKSYVWEAKTYVFSLFTKDNFYTKNRDKMGNDNNQTLESLKSFTKTLSKFERYFWITIGVLALLFLTLFFIAYLNNQEVIKNESVTAKKSQTMVDTYIDKYFATDKLKTNLEAHQKEIEANLKKETIALSNTIDREINHVFASVAYRIDSYLDYHYSVAGEYSELYAMASNKIDKVIEQKLMGSDFAYNLKSASDNIYAQYDTRIKEHLSFINSIAYEEVDINIDMNKQTLEQLQTEIMKNQMLQQGKFSLLISAMIAKKISAVIVAKLAAKASAKLATKGAVKVGTKAMSAAGAGLAGVVCGPGVVICAPLLALGAWFATDAVIVTADEHFNRDSFRMELESMIDTQKYQIKRELKATYAQSFEVVSQSTQAKIAMTSVQEKRRVKVTD